MPPKKATRVAAPPPAAAEEGTDGSDDDNMFGNPYADAMVTGSKRERIESGGGSSRSVLPTVLGVTLDIKPRVITSGPKVMHKEDMVVFVTGVQANGANTIIDTGEGMEWFILPSRIVPGQAIATEGEAKFQAKEREMVYREYARVRKLHCIRISVWEAVDVKPGCPVRITNVEANWKGTDDGNEPLYLNGNKAFLEGPAPPKGGLGAHMCAFAATAQMQSRACLAASVAMEGYFNTSFLNDLSPGAFAQAEVTQGRWRNYQNSAVRELQARAGVAPPQPAAALKATAGVIAANSVESYAAGHALLPTEMYDDGHRAILLQSGVTPARSIKMSAEPVEGEAPPPPTLMAISGAMIKLKGAAAPEALTPAMAAMVVSKVDFTGDADKGKGLAVEAQVVLIPDTKLACNALKEDPNATPWLVSKGPAMAFSMSARFYAHKFAVTDRAMFQWAAVQFFHFGTFSGIPKLLPVQRNDNATVTVASAWPEGGQLWFDMATSLATIGLKVSAAFVQKHLCGGTDQFVGTRKLNEETAYTLPDGATGLPKLDNSGYQMLTVHQGLAWTFSDLIDDGAREFRVIYADSHRAVRKDKTLTETEATAEAHLEAKAAEAKVDAGKWMKQSCLVYALL